MTLPTLPAVLMAGTREHHTVEPADRLACRCEDDDVQRLRDLITAGWSQEAASRAVWGGEEL